MKYHIYALRPDPQMTGSKNQRILQYEDAAPTMAEATSQAQDIADWFSCITIITPQPNWAINKFQGPIVLATELIPEPTEVHPDEPNS
jgi:hypothetical protein